MMPADRSKRDGLWRCLMLCGALLAPFATSGWSAADEDDEAILRDYHSGNGLLSRGLHEMAVTEYRKFLDEHGDHGKAGPARYGLAVCLYKLEQPEEAISLLTPLSRLPKFEFAADTLMLLGQCRLGKQDYAAATRAFEMLVSRHPSHKLAGNAAALVVEAAYRSGDLQAVGTAYAKFVKRSPKSDLRERVDFFWGLALMGLGDYGRAAGRFAALVEQFGEGVFAGQARLLAAQCYHRAGDHDPARRYYKAVIKKADPRRVPEALLGLGVLWQEQGRHPEAKREFAQLLDGFANYSARSDARLRLGQCCVELGDYKQAQRVLQEISGESGNADQAAYWLAKANLKLEQHAKAGDILSKAIEQHPSSPLLPEMTYDLGVAKLRAGDLAGAIAAFGRHLARFPKHDLAPEALYLIALTEHQRKDFDQSQTHCKAFTDEYPKHERISRVAFLLGENEYLSGKHEAAAREFDRFLQQFSDDAQAPQARFRLGMALYHLEQYDRARAVLEQVEELGQGDGALHSALLALGDVQFHDGNWSEAERLLSKYLQGEASDSAVDFALLKLGLALVRQDKSQDAIKYFNRLISEFDGSLHRVQALFERGQIFVSLGEMDKAVADFQGVLKADPESRFAPHALNHLGWISTGRREYAKAAEYFAGAAERDEAGGLKGEAHFQRAQVLMAAGQYDMAEKAFEGFLATFPKHEQAATALSQLVVSLARQKRYTEALSKITVFEERYAAATTGELAAAVQYEKTWALRALGKNIEAVSAYRRTIKQAGESVLAAHSLVELAALVADGGNAPEAVGLLERFEKLSAEGNLQIEDSVKEQSAYLLGVYLFKSEKFEQASRSFQRFIERFGESIHVPSASFFGGECCFKLGQHSRAIAHLSRVVKQYPSHELFGPSLLRLGECLAVLQKWARSEQVFEQYASRFPDSELWFQARFGVGWARENQGRHEEALRAYGKIVEKHKGETAARAQFQIGECLFAQEKFEPAVRELLKVEILYSYPEWSAAALYEAGRCLERLGRQEQARAQFAQVTEKYKQTSWSAMASKRLTEL